MDGEMDPTNLAPSASSTIAASTVTSSSSSEASTTFQASNVLEISLISAQDLPQVSKSMRTYAIVWVHPNKKLTTRVDNQGHNNPTWNERFTFRVDDELLNSDQAAVMVEIYTVSWFRDVHVGTVRVLMSDLITPYASNNTRFVALQIRRSSGNPQGKLNMGVALMDCTKRSMPICNNYHNKIDKNGVICDDEHKVFDNMQHLWRSYSIGTSDLSENFHGKAGSMVNGSMVYGSEICSDVGPSASIVAAEIALKSQNRPPMADRSCPKEALLDNKGNSIVMDITLEEARAKGLMSSNLARWKKEAAMNQENEEEDEDDGESEIKDQESARKHARRHSDGGLISCFGSAYGFEFKIVCGKPKENKTQRKRIIASSETSSA